jgi:hypothetical protein
MTVCIADTSSSDYEQSAHMKRVHYQYVLFSQLKYWMEPPHIHAQNLIRKNSFLPANIIQWGSFFHKICELLFCLTLMPWTGAPYIIHYLHNTCKKKCTPTTATWAHKGLKAKILIFCHCITLHGLEGLLSIIKGRSMYLIFINI